MCKVNLELPATEQVFELALVKYYKKLRNKQTHVLLQIPNEVLGINPSFDWNKRYGVTIGVNKAGQKYILLNLDDNKESINNRR